MKKTVPAIFTLITLSILGVLFIQITWLQGLFLLSKNQLSEKINQTGIIVVSDIAKKMNSGLSFRLPKRGTLSLENEYHMHKFEEPTVSDMYDSKEVDTKIQAAFKRFDIGDLKYEFAIADKKGIIELKTKKFDDSFTDDINTMQVRLPIMPQDIMEPVGPFETLIIVVPNVRLYLLHSLQWIILGAVLFILVVLAAFFITTRSLLNQRKVNEIKNDFINNMTHELKTPLATISLAVDALKSSKVQSDPKSVEYFSTIIKEENVRMNKHVETILEAGQLDKKELELNKQKVDIHDLIHGVLDSFKLQLEEKPSSVNLDLRASIFEANVDEEHIIHVLSNLIDNAIKYSKDTIDILISTSNINNKIVIAIEDNGIGMSSDTSKRIFEKFYRAHSGNIHNVKGFGLGMSYVKWVVQMHKGNIKVQSELDHGTTIELSLPLV
ncbi:MAG: sensor histidine kinase [Chitinophagia bacterium]|nr:sensor histidine kinase [Chitinophagia bacterium]